jgi:hypothetical protein
VINHIDVSSVLRRTVCDLYSNLVTRPTGAAVRTEIENLLSAGRGPSLTVIDFSHVNLLDYSCADEVVAKLLLRFEGAAPAQDAYFLLRGVREDHLDAIEAALERYRLALVMQADDGALLLVGTVNDDQRRAWQALRKLGRGAAEEIALALGEELADAQALLVALHERRLVMRFDDTYVPLGATP